MISCFRDLYYHCHWYQPYYMQLQGKWKLSFKGLPLQLTFKLVHVVSLETFRWKNKGVNEFFCQNQRLVFLIDLDSSCYLM